MRLEDWIYFSATRLSLNTTLDPKRLASSWDKLDSSRVLTF
jgi:hypothetical protein